MAISKERLEHLIEQCQTVYVITYDTNYPHEKKVIKAAPALCRDMPDSYETQSEAQWHADNDAERTECFRPPMKLDRELGFDFYDKNHAKYRIYEYGKTKFQICAVYQSDEVGDGESLITVQVFNTYPETVDYARKLFNGGIKL